MKRTEKEGSEYRTQGGKNSTDKVSGARSKLRRQIAYEAARLMYWRQESEYYRAKLKAGRNLCHGWVKPSELPSNAEIREEIQTFARLHEGESRDNRLLQMRIEALRVMKLLSKFRPKLCGSVMTGHVRQGSDIDLHVFADSLTAVTTLFDDEGTLYDVERKTVRKNGETKNYIHVHVQDTFQFEVTVYPYNQANIVPKCSITGKPMQRATIAELEILLANQYPDLCVEDAVAEAELRPDRFRVYESLLLPLENVKQSRKWHPEGDALYHSLQVYDHACDDLPYDEEFLLAALLHDVGKGIDPDDHVYAGLEALEGFITPRTAWLIEHHMEAHLILDRTIGARAHKRLKQDENYHELVLLGECDAAGRERGVSTSSLDEALDYCRELSDTFG